MPGLLAYHLGTLAADSCPTVSGARDPAGVKKAEIARTKALEAFRKLAKDQGEGQGSHDKVCSFQRIASCSNQCSNFFHVAHPPKQRLNAI